MKKPEKIPFVEYYLQPIIDILIWITEGFCAAISEEALSVRDELQTRAGRWYCGYCKKYHGGRVRKLHEATPYNPNEWCSLAHERQERQEEDI